MEHLGLSRMDAAWFTPVVTLIRMQRVYLENMGEEQKWAPSRLDLIMEMEDNAKQSGTSSESNAQQ